MKIHYLKAAIAGIVGTAAFDITGLVLTGTFWDIPALIGSKLTPAGGLAVGVVAHYANGVLLAILYGALAPSLWGPRWARALTFVTAETVFGVWFFMLPLLGLGPLGLKAGLALPFIALARHWAYGAALAALYPVAEAPAYGAPLMAGRERLGA